VNHLNPQSCSGSVNPLNNQSCKSYNTQPMCIHPQLSCKIYLNVTTSTTSNLNIYFIIQLIACLLLNTTCVYARQHHHKINVRFLYSRQDNRENNMPYSFCRNQGHEFCLIRDLLNTWTRWLSNSIKVRSCWGNYN
jgi:hypothetical protein